MSQKITLTVKKSIVWDEVAKTTGYTGDKIVGDDNAYERILLTDEDSKQLQRFWEEAAAAANDQLKEMLVSSSPMSSDYQVELLVSSNYDTTLNGSVQTALTSYFIAAISGRWFKFSKKDECESYFADAVSMINDALRKLYSRKRPKRPAGRDNKAVLGDNQSVVGPVWQGVIAKDETVADGKQPTVSVVTK